MVDVLSDLLRRLFSFFFIFLNANEIRIGYNGLDSVAPFVVVAKCFHSGLRLDVTRLGFVSGK